MMDDKIKLINNDLNLVRGLAKGSIQRKQNTFNSIQSLGKLIKSRNDKYNYTKEQKANAYNYLRRYSAGDTKALEQRIKARKLQQQQTRQNKKVQSDCYFYLPQIKLNNQEDYLNKYVQFSVFNMVQTAMSNINRKKLTRELILNVRASKKNQLSHLNNILPTCYSRSINKKNQYSKLIKSYIMNEKKQNLIDLLTENFSGSRVWKIISYHLKSLQGMQNSKPYIRLVNASIILVEKQFQKLLTGRIGDQYAMSDYLKTNYLNKIKRNNDKDNKIQFDKEKFWGICFLYYRAGLKQQFYKMFQSLEPSKPYLKQIKTQFKHYDNSIYKGTPQKINAFWPQSSNTNDIFYIQLIYILKGTSKFSHEILCDSTKLDMTWLILRTLGLYISDQQSREQFFSIRQKMFNQYIDNDADHEIIVINMLYLLGYQKIALMGSTNFLDMDIDDYLHFLVIIVNNPILIPSQQRNIKNLLKQRLISYINQLILQKKEQYLSYMLLIPPQLLPQEGSSIIASSQLIEEIDWNFVQKNLKEKTYELIELTLRKYIVYHKSYFFAAKKYVSLLKNPMQALKVIKEMLIRSAIDIKFTDQDIQGGENLAGELYNQSPNQFKQIWNVISLLIESRILSKLILDRRHSEAFELLKKSNYIVRNNVQTKQYRRALQILVQENSLQAYFKFLQSAFRAIESSFTPFNIQKLQSQIVFSTQLILRRQCASKYANKKVVLNLKNYLNYHPPIIQK